MPAIRLGYYTDSRCPELLLNRKTMRGMGADELTKTTAIKKHYRGLGRAVGRSQIQADFDIVIIPDTPRMAQALFRLSRMAIRR